VTDRIPLASVLSSDRSVLARIADRIRNNDVFVYPTETIYGIGGRSDSKTVEQRIVSIKGRTKSSPFIRIAANLSGFSLLKLQFPEKAGMLAEKFWPGNLTLIVPSNNNSNGVGIRISDHPFISALNTELGIPVFSTSANISDRPYVNDPDAIFRIFDGMVDFMIDAGSLPESKPSTIVKLFSDGGFEIVREGAIPKEKIIEALS
jgi:L-threonylcarbamoyladenylate synthase